MGRRPNEGFSMSSFEWMELQTLTNDIELSRSRLVEARKSGDRGRVTALEEEIGRAENRRLQLLAHISTNIVTIPEAGSKGKDAGSRQEEASKPAGDAARAAEPAPPARARGGAGSRQAPPPAAKPVPEEAEEEPAAAKARDGAGARQTAASPVEAVKEEAAAPPPSGGTAAGPEPAPPSKARESAAAEPAPREAASAPEPTPPPKARETTPPASAPPAEAATKEPPPGETASAPEPAPPPKAREGAGSRPAFAKADSVEGGTIVWDQLKPSDIARVKNEIGTRRAEMLARHAEELKELDAEQTQLETLEQAIEMFLRKANRTESAVA